MLSGQIKPNLGYLGPAKMTLTELDIDDDVAWPMFYMAA